MVADPIRSRATRRRVALPLSFLAALGVAHAALRPHTNRLFVIERSLNSNVVVYEAVRAPDGRLDPAEPVSAYWLMNAEHGQRQPLNPIEKLEAYGFKVQRDDRGSVTLKVVALESRPIHVLERGRRVEALVRIAGAPAVLHRVYVRTEPGHPLKVESVELLGERLDTHAAVRETLRPS